jgi:hypothetical protein
LDVDHPARDLPVVGHRTGGSHGLVGGEGHEGDKS